MTQLNCDFKGVKTSLLEKVQSLAIESFCPNFRKSSRRSDAQHKNKHQSPNGKNKLKSISPYHGFDPTDTGVKHANATDNGNYQMHF
jgi:hypothetical protein